MSRVIPWFRNALPAALKQSGEAPSAISTSTPDGARVYLAARYARREELREIALELERLGFEVTSRWLYEDAAIPSRQLSPTGRAAEVAEMDFRDVCSADVCVAFTESSEGPQGRGGRHTEVGIALGRGQRVVLVGPREQVFHCLPDVEQFEDWRDARNRVFANRLHSAAVALAPA